MARKGSNEIRAARFTFGFAASFVRPILALMLKRTWVGMGSIKPGSVIVSNHISELDPLIVAEALYVHKLFPRFLAKSSLFKIPVVGRILKATGQIPVERGGPEAKLSLEAAAEVIGRGGVIIIYPEGTLTKDPDQWPMQARTGAARLALKTNAPIVPVVHWGDQELLSGKPRKLRLFPRKATVVMAGSEIDMDDLRDGPMTRSVLDEATSRIVKHLMYLVADLRGEEPPKVPWSPTKDAEEQLKQREEENGAARSKRTGNGRR